MSALDEATDGELALLARSGRQQAFRMLAERHRDAVYRIVRGATGDDTAAVDITQESFIAAFGALDRYDGDRSFRSWIARIALNKSRDWARRRRVRRAFSLPFSSESEAVVSPEAPVDDAVYQRAQLKKAQRLIASLPSRQRDVLLLRAIEGMSQAETAAALGISEKAVETRLARARRTLSDAMKKTEG